jgi:hypothetical protein
VTILSINAKLIVCKFFIAKAVIQARPVSRIIYQMFVFNCKLFSKVLPAFGTAVASSSKFI